MSNFFESNFALLIALLLTAFAIWNPFQWRFLHTYDVSNESYTKMHRSDSEYSLWNQLIELLIPIKQTIRAELGKSIQTVQLHRRSLIDIALQLEEIGSRLANKGKTTTQVFAGRSLLNTSLVFQKRIYGEKSFADIRDGTLGGILDAIEELHYGIENQIGSSVYLALIKFNYVVQANSAVPASVNPESPPLGKKFGIAIERLVSAHFVHGNYTALDEFIDTWRPESIKMGDIYALAFISALDSYKAPIYVLLRILSSPSEHPDQIVLSQIGQSIVRSFRAFANAYSSGNLLEQYAALNRLVLHGSDLKH